ncbi:MAG: hypothetical protein ACE5LU_07840 [Anaerolineae bacterium]
MIQDAEELAVSQERLQELEARVEKIVADPRKSRRVKEMELAGVRGMMMQIEREIWEHSLSKIQQSIHAIQGELESGGAGVDLPGVVFRTLGVLEEITRVLEPAVNAIPQLDGSDS